MHGLAPALLLTASLAGIWAPGVWAGLAQAPSGGPAEDAAEAARELAEARAEGAAANARAGQLEADAARANAVADRTAREAAAVALRIQQAEADIAADAASIRLIDRQRAILRASIAERQRPLLRLTAALQLLSRRPLTLALLRPGSVEDAMHLHALLETMLPEVRQRTAALRAELARGRALQAQALSTQTALRATERLLDDRRRSLAALETRQRLAARDVSGSADREAEHALALAEQARDLSGLMTELGQQDTLEEELARLPGPVPRPDDGRTATEPVAGLAGTDTAIHPGTAQPPNGLPSPDTMLPAAGRLVTGFGEAVEGGPRTQGIAIAANAGAQVVAPGPGRVAFAGPYRGYGQIVIIAQDGGWTSLVTGLAELDVQVSDQLVAGSPLGIAGPVRPVLTLELRHDGVPVDPLQGPLAHGFER